MTEGAQDAVAADGGVQRYLDDYTVVPRGGGRLLMSSVPLRHRDGSGRSVPTDLSLVEDGNAVQPVSSPAPVAIADSFRGGVVVNDVGVTVNVGGGADPAAQTFDDNSVVYPRVATDTDAVAAATAQGAELFTVLRSADSPEQEQLSVDVPAGGRLLADASGGAHVEAADGSTAVSISAPRAQDAVGRDVPVQMTPSADGRSLEIDVPHRGLGFAYPILVDPVVSPWLDGSGNGWWFSGHRDGLERWGVSDGHGSGAAFAPRSTCYTPVSCYATNGLYIYAYGGYTYSPGANTGFALSLDPSRTAYFKSVRFVNTYFNRRGDPAPAPFLAAGILDMTAGGWTGLTTTQSSLTNATLTIPANMGTIAHGKEVWFGLFVDAWRTLPNWEEAYTGGVVLEVEDPEAPTITGVTGAGGPLQTGWVRGTTSISPTATDPGLGVWQYAIAIPGLLTPSGGSVGYAQGCTGRIGDECPTSYTRTISWDSSAMPNGANQIALWAYDPSLHLSGARTWNLNIDNEQPTLASSGSLSDARGTDISPDTTSALHVAATDGDSTHARSGVGSIAIAVDRDTATTSQSCPTTQNSCSLTADRTISPSSLAPGSHTVTVTVTDRAGNVRQDSWQVGLYPTSWHYGGSDHRVNTASEIAGLEAAIAAADSTTSAALYAGLAPDDTVRLNTSRDHTAPDIYEINRPGYWVNDPNLFFDFGASDSGSGIRVLRTFAPAVPGWQGIGSSQMLNGCVTDTGIQCVGNAHVRSVVSNLDSGLQTIQVQAIDANGNETDRQFHLPVDKEAPTATMGGGLWTSAGSTVTAGDLQVTANDGYSGVNSIALYEKMADGSLRYITGTSRSDAQCPGYGCTPLGMTLSTTIDLSQFSPGSHQLEVDVWDRAGNVNPITWTIGVGYGGANGFVDTPDEVQRIVDAMAAATPSGRQAIWAGMNQSSRDYYVNLLLPDARQSRQDFNLDSSDTTIRTVFNDPTTQGTIANLGTPLTSSESAYVSDDSPPGSVYDGAPDADVLASQYATPDTSSNGILDTDSAIDADSPDSVGCDPTVDTGCNDGATMTLSAESQANPTTDDLTASAAKTESADALQAGATSSWFSRAGARKDAEDHALSPRTGLYAPVGNSDCTNFVSQVWHLGGGLRMTGRWFIKQQTVLGVLKRRTDTWSWALVRNFVDYMVNTRQVARLITATPSSFKLPSGAAYGDAVEYDWGRGEGWSHLAVVVNTSGNYDYISQHSVNRRDSLWDLGWEQEQNETIKQNMHARVVHVRVR